MNKDYFPTQLEWRWAESPSVESIQGDLSQVTVGLIATLEGDLMAVLTGVNGELLINGITVAKCRSLQLNQQRDAIEVTPLGDEWRTYVSGLKGATGSASLYYDNSDAGTKLLLGNLTGNTGTTVTFVFNRGGSEEWACKGLYYLCRCIDFCW